MANANVQVDRHFFAHVVKGQATVWSLSEDWTAEKSVKALSIYKHVDVLDTVR